AEAAADVFEDVRWLNDPKAPTTIPATGAINPVRGGHTPEPLASVAPARGRTDPRPPPPIPATGASTPVRGGHTPEPLASVAPARVPALLDGLRKLLSPSTAAGACGP